AAEWNKAPNETRDKYRKKWLIVTGKGAWTVPRVKDEVSLVLKGEGKMNIDCVLTPDEAAFLPLFVGGKPWKLFGRFTGDTTAEGLELRSCLLIQAEGKQYPVRSTTP